jgi:hypothetical protein
LEYPFVGHQFSQPDQLRYFFVELLFPGDGHIWHSLIVPNALVAASGVFRFTLQPSAQTA